MRLQLCQAFVDAVDDGGWGVGSHWRALTAVGGLYPKPRYGRFARSVIVARYAGCRWEVGLPAGKPFFWRMNARTSATCCTLQAARLVRRHADPRALEEIVDRQVVPFGPELGARQRRRLIHAAQIGRVTARAALRVNRLTAFRLRVGVDAFPRSSSLRQ